MSNREFFAALLAGEKERTARVLAAVPEGDLDWRPAPKSRTARELVSHLIAHDQDLEELVATGTCNHRLAVPFGSMADAVALYQRANDDAVAAAQRVSDADWSSPGRFLVNGQTIYELPRQQLAWILFLDAVHHRGQLSTYLRPMGGTVPGIYGPSADTPRS
jgi:uncharacterized damage-inducible protein DinB